ncbi:MAG: TPM domain-containing protein [Vicingaceae bacterium]|nr:TPM domain-containing protein [Vicingaceae bacterium]
MKKLLYIFLLLFSFTSLSAQEDKCLLDQPAKQDLVQDYADIIDAESEAHLRKTLIAFNDTTSTQILVITLTNLCNKDKVVFSHELLHKWGIGQDGKNNGIVIMVKPKEFDGKGETYIAVGYGLEGVLPDAIAKRIVENEMIPYFKEKKYSWGIIAGVNTVMSITSGEFSADEYAKKNSAGWIPFVFVLLFIVFFVLLKSKGASKYASSNNLGFWAALMLMNASNRSHGGSFGNFGSGGGSFGGFGGGSSGGGGAGGSW